MENKMRLIDVNDAVRLLRGKCVAKYPSTFFMGLLAAAAEVEKAPTVDAVPLDQYNELKERYKGLLETANILDSALREYQRKYGDLDDEDANMDGGNEDG